MVIFSTVVSKFKALLVTVQALLQSHLAPPSHSLHSKHSGLECTLLLSATEPFTGCSLCLEHYSLAEGAADRIRITIPKGGYVPQFIVTEEAAPSVLKALGDADPPKRDNWPESFQPKRLPIRLARWRALRVRP